MEAVKLSPETVTAISQVFMETIYKNGLVIVPKNVGEYGTAFSNKRKKLLRRKYVTPYEIVKYKLIDNVKTINTIKNMVKDNRISGNEYFEDEKGRLKILTTAIKRINDG